jgi:hypothetical protein
MSKNPFGQLSVRRDDDDEVTIKTVQHTTASSDPLFQQKEADKKKKKVRPEENKKENVQTKEDNLEGFEVVGKTKQKQKTRGDEEEQQVERKDRKPKNKGAFEAKPPREGKRQFERHSGTGRGKEIAKGGAGGHHTWGSNPKQIAKEGEREVDYYSNDDKWFRSALSEKKPEDVKEIIEEEPQKEVEEVRQEEVAAPQEIKERRKRKGEEEEKKEDDLERPENALSLAEYKELLRQKNQGLDNKPKTVVKANETDAQFKTKEEGQFVLGLTTEDKKKDKKIKDKKVDSREKDITASVVSNLKTDDGTSRDKHYGKQEKKGGKFRFNANEFPEL